MSSKQIAIDYFAANPKAKDDVVKAYYAWHAPHGALTADGHMFSNEQRWSQCIWCQRSREQVRYDDLPAQCQHRPVQQPITNVVRSEEERYFALLATASRVVPKVIAQRGNSPDTFNYLHATHGFDREIVEEIINS